MAVVVLCIDQAAKYVVDGLLEVGESWPAYGLFSLTHVTNTGNTVNLFSGHSLVLIGVSAGGIALLFALYWPRPKTGVMGQVAFGLMLAGVTGNLADRVILGHVTDFINVVPWFIFNPNPPKGYGAGVDTGDDGYGKANRPGLIPTDGVEGSARWPRWRQGGVARWRSRRNRPGRMPEATLADWAGMNLRDSPWIVRWTGRASTARRQAGQAGRGMARNRARA